LVGPFERAITILCHTASRALVLLGVARGKWFWPFVAGFMLMTIVDSIAGYVYLTGMLGKINMWWVEFAITPIALLGIPITSWCIRRWPSATAAGDSQAAAITAT
jgi:hypothetical protein